MHTSATDLFWPFITVGLCTITWFVAMRIERTRVLRRRAAMKPWQVRLENDIREYIDTMLHAAELEKDMAFLVKDMPQEFVASTFKAMALGQTIPRAVLREARARGLLDVQLEEPTREDIRAAEAENNAEAQVVDRSATIPPPPLRPVTGRRWRDGQVLPRAPKVA